MHVDLERDELRRANYSLTYGHYSKCFSVCKEAGRHFTRSNFPLQVDERADIC